MSKDDDQQLSRRTFLQAGLAVLAGGVSCLAATEQKIAQNLVQYQDKARDAHECDQCLHFVAPDSCRIVAGKINAKGWCAAFAAK